MVLYPSEEWLNEYCRALSECDDLEAFGFSEDILIEITDLGFDELRLGDIEADIFGPTADSVLAELADVPLAELVDDIDETVRSSLPEPAARLLAQAERNVVDDSLYVYVELDGGTCFGPVLVDDPAAVDYGCLFRAPATVWQSIIAGRPATAAVLSGDLKIRGNPAFLLKYVAELQLLCDVAAGDVDTEFLFDRPSRSLLQMTVDESIRHPIAIQKGVTREAMLAVRRFTPF